MAKQKVDDSENQLRDLAIKRNIEIGEMDLDKMDRDEFMKELLRARQLGVFLRDREMSRRIEGGQVIRWISMVDDDNTRKEYIEMSMPQVLKEITKKE